MWGYSLDFILPASVSVSACLSVCVCVHAYACECVCLLVDHLAYWWQTYLALTLEEPMDVIPSIWSKPPELLLLPSKSRNKQHPASSIAHQILPANPSWINTRKTVVETEEIQTRSCKQDSNKSLCYSLVRFSLQCKLLHFSPDCLTWMDDTRPLEEGVLKLWSWAKGWAWILMSPPVLSFIERIHTLVLGEKTEVLKVTGSV